MNEFENHPEDRQLSQLVRESRVSPELRPRFHQSVWRRIEDAEDADAEGPAWLAALARRVLRPRFALVMVLALTAGGALFGVRGGHELVRRESQARYLASVAPGTLQ